MSRRPTEVPVRHASSLPSRARASGAPPGKRFNTFHASVFSYEKQGSLFGDIVFALHKLAFLKHLICCQQSGKLASVTLCAALFTMNSYSLSTEC